MLASINLLGLGLLIVICIAALVVGHNDINNRKDD